MTIAELRAMASRLVNDAEAIVTKAETESRDLTKDEASEVESMLKRAKNLDGIVEARSRALSNGGDSPPPAAPAATPEVRAVQPGSPTAQEPKGEQRTRAEIETDAFLSYCRHGVQGLTPEQRDVLNDGLRREFNDREKAELRTLVGGTPAAGGYTIPEGFYGVLSEAQKQFNAIRRAPVTIIRTGTGAPLPMVETDDTANEGAIVAEAGSHAGGTDPVFGQSVLNSYTYSSRVVPVSWELLQDSYFDLGSYLARILGTRIGRASGKHFTTGTGTGQPQGIVTGAPIGHTTAAAGTLTYDDIVDFIESIDEAYQGPGFGIMFSQATRKVLAKIKDNDGRPLWSPAAQGLPATVYDKPYMINNDMPAPTAGNDAIVAGDLSKYMIREVAGGTTVLRLNELYAENGSVGFLAFSRQDGRLVDAGSGDSAAVKKLRIASP